MQRAKIRHKENAVEIEDKRSEQYQVTDEPNQTPISGNDYELATGESLSRTLDLDTWHPGADLMEMYERLSKEVAEAVKEESRFQKQIRAEIFPLLSSRSGAPSGAGVYRVSAKQLETVHRKLLFNGGVEACDGTVVSHNTLPVTITQIGVCLVSYRGDQGSWVHRIFRRDLRASGKNPIDETLDLLERRSRRGGVDQQNSRDRLTSLARRGIMAYAERAVLLDKSDAVWRMGHGNPTPYELITGSGMRELLQASIEMMKRLILGHKRFIFILSDTAAQELITIGNALHPLEYAIVDTNEGFMNEIIRKGHYRGEGWKDLGNAVTEFAKECGPKIIVGLYRVSELARCQLFFAHVDHAHEAALIAMADSVLQEHRGFPMLIDLADGLCSTFFGAETFSMTAQLAYAEADVPFKYMSERKTRNR